MVDDPVRYRFRSLRAYRRLLDRVMREAYEGKRPPSDLGHFQTAAKTAADLLMAERLMHRHGGDNEVAEEEAAHGDDGGLDLPRRGEYRRKRVVVRSGVSAKGTPVDETVTTVEGAEDDPEVEAEANEGHY